MHVACAADQRYIPHCATMLSSLLDHNCEVVIHFLHSSNLNSTLISQLQDLVCARGALFQSHEMAENCLEGLPRLRNIPPLMWYRVYLPELLPDIDRVLYVDADTLIMSNLSELQNIDMTDCYVAAVENVFERALEAWPAQLGLPIEAGYFNSGVLLLNLNAMRFDNIHKQILDVGRTSPVRLRWPDQDALNKVIGGRRIKLHPRWNCQSSLFYYSEAGKLFGNTIVEEAINNPAIVHFEGGIKPWHYLSRHPYRQCYFEYRRNTPWPEVEIEGRSVVNIILRLLPHVSAISVLMVARRLRLAFRRILR